MKDIIIVGFGGFGREVAVWAEDCGRDVAGFLDDATPVGLHGRFKVLGGVLSWSDYTDAQFVVAVGDPRTRKMLVEKMCSIGEPPFATLIHPTVVRDDSSREVGEGSIICAGCVMTTDYKIGRHVIINICSTVAHDNVLGDFVTVAPMVAISGNVTLENGVEIGTAAALRQGVHVAEGAMVGMGSVLTKDVPANTIFLGNPAREFKSLPPF